MQHIAIIGDIVDSRKVENRFRIQEKLHEVLGYVNEVYSDEISAKFIVTLGDEFQGLLKSGGKLLSIIRYIQKRMYPVKLRFGVGVGTISTYIFSEAAIGADGPAYYAARMMIGELREQEKKLKKQAPDIKIAYYNQENFEIEEINMMLALTKIIEDNWSDKQRFTIWDMLQNGGSQTECAKRMDTTQSTVARRLAEGNYIIYNQATETIREALKRLGEGQYDK